MAEHRVGSCSSPNSYGNDFVSQQAKLAMRQRPAPFFFRPLAAMIVGAVRLDALMDDQGQVPLAGQGDHVAMAVIGHPQGLTTLLTLLLERS